MSRPILAIPLHISEMISRLFEREGYISDHPLDKGGYTKWGITLSTLSRWMGRPATRQDLKDMTEETARQIYYQMYWVDTKVDRVEVYGGREIAEFIFDWRVNSGSAIFELQEYLGVKRDGDLGIKSVHALSERARDIGWKQVMQELCDHRTDFYVDLCRMDPSQIAFLRGWLNRVKHFRPKFSPK